MIPHLTIYYITLCLCMLVKGQGNADIDLDLINIIFSQPASSTTPQPETAIPGTEQCKCVPYYLCNNGVINTNGEGFIDIRINAGPCGNEYLDVCCEEKNTVAEPITPPTSVSKPTGCGYRNANGLVFKITGAADGEAEFGEYPWMVALLKEETIEGNPLKLNVYKCGGSLIHPQVVLTAAHCVAGSTAKFKIRAGEWDTQHEKEPLPFQDRDVKSFIIHPQFHPRALFNDVALLFLESPVDKSEHISTVCLPPQDHDIEHLRGFATGWGKDQFGKAGKYQVILKKIELPVVNNNDCQTKLRTSRLGKYFKLDNSFMCAGGERGKDTCKGDGGSPFVLPTGTHTDRYFQAGIVAWGIGCGDEHYPGVYTNVAKFRKWIDTQMIERHFDTSTYQY